MTFPVGDASKVGDKPKIDTSDERKALDTFDEISDDKGDNKENKEGDEEDNEEGKDDKDTEEGEEGTEEDGEEGEEEEGKEDKEDSEAEEDDAEAEALTEDNVYQQVKKLAPKLLKELPELRSVIFREREFSTIYPTIEDAREAKETAETFNTFQEDILSGESENLLGAVKKLGDDKLEGFVANFIPSVQKVSKELYLGMLYPEFKKLFQAAAKSGNDNLVISAKNLNHFLFGDTDVDKAAPGLKVGEEDKVTKREREFEQKVEANFRNDLVATGNVRARKIISLAFKDSGLSELTQKHLTDEIYNRVDAALSKDPRHMGNIEHLYKQAKREGFTSIGKDRIINATLSRAKGLIPQIRQKVLTEAKVSAKEGHKDGKKPIRVPSSGAQRGSDLKPGQKVDIKKVDMTKTSERDLLDGKITYKK